jgi:hypothetical protein
VNVLRRARPVLWAASIALASLACAKPFSVRVGECPSLGHWPASGATDLKVQYLGVGGFLLQRGSAVVLTAPLYSNPSLVEVVADHRIAPDTALIERLLPAEGDQAAVILVGHSHYDHLMDVPYVATRRSRAAQIVGSESLRKLLAWSAPLRSRITCVDDQAQGCERPGTWFFPSGQAPDVRVMALRSRHSAQVTLKMPSGQNAELHLWRGEAPGPLAEPPRSASDWVEGGVFAYLVDFLGANGRVAFRVYYQDSGASPPYGYAPASAIAERRVDVAILCVGGDFRRLQDHPEGIIANLKPRFVVLSHWEDFFTTQENQVRDGRFFALPTVDPFEEQPMREFLRRARAALKAVSPNSKPVIPCPTLSRFVFPAE